MTDLSDIAGRLTKAQRVVLGEVERLILAYADEVSRTINRTPSGPLRTALMGEYSATVVIRQSLGRRFAHLEKES